MVLTYNVSLMLCCRPCQSWQTADSPLSPDHREQTEIDSLPPLPVERDLSFQFYLSRIIRHRLGLSDGDSEYSTPALGSLIRIGLREIIRQPQENPPSELSHSHWIVNCLQIERPFVLNQTGASKGAFTHSGMRDLFLVWSHYFAHQSPIDLRRTGE